MACQEKKTTYALEGKLSLEEERAENLAKLPLACLSQAYPNKLGQVLGSDADLATPEVLHPAFYGCFDWHSSVHGHWSLVRLLKQFPNMDQAAKIKEVLRSHLSEKNIKSEIAYFNQEHNKNYERTYGWAWLLKLQSEFEQWDTPLGQELGKNLKPLSNLIVKKLKKYLPKLEYPIRVGTHTNTAFALSMAYDYSQIAHDQDLTKAVESKALSLFLSDKDAPLHWEPSGHDFLSPILEEIDIMRKVLSKSAFNNWMKDFLPRLKEKEFHLAPAKVSDRKDGHLVHLDGLNFSRAWCLNGLAKQYPSYAHLIPIAQKHIEQALPSIFDDYYEGGHWLGSFAINALGSR